MKRPIGIDLFAGAGGMSLGFEMAGFDVVAAVEIDPVHCATHEFNFPKCKTICRSVTDLTGESILKMANIKNEVDVVFGGAPCQGFSMIGHRVLDDPRNSLIVHYLRIVKEIKPKAFVFENVKGLTLGEHKKLLEEFILESKNNGYKIIEPYKVLNAADFGVPQDRQRLFLIGVRNEFDYPSYPQPTFCSPKNKKQNLSLFNLPIGPTVQDALSDLPDVEMFEKLLQTDSIKVKFSKPSSYARVLRGEEELEDDYSYKRSYNPNILTSSTRTVHTAESIKRFLATKPGSTEPKSRLYKLSLEGICNTIRAGTDSQRGAHTSPRPLHPIHPRVITVREAARLHSYPDWFRFHVTKWHGFRQIGNSVPPFLAKAVASCLIKSLNIKPLKPSKALDLGDEKLLSFNMTEASAYFNVSPTVIPQRIRKIAQDVEARV